MARVYIPILMHLIAVVAVAGGMLGLSWWVGVKRPSKEKLGPYECGSIPGGRCPRNFFRQLLFDRDAFYLVRRGSRFPLSMGSRLQEPEWSGFIEMSLYIGILLAGYIYLWKKGALDWTR